MSYNFLFDEFPAVSPKDWETAVLKFLKGAELSSLDWSIGESFIIPPYPRNNAKDTSVNLFLKTQEKNKDWVINEDIVPLDFKLANKEALKALDAGCSGITFNIPTYTKQSIASLLENIHTAFINVSFTLGMDSLEEVKLFLDALVSASPNIKGQFNFKSLSLNTQIALAKQYKKDLPNMRWIMFHVEADASNAVNALAHILLDMHKLLAEGKSLGFSIDEIIPLINIHFSIGNLYFVEIAAIRAFKRMWLGLLEAYNTESAKYPFISAQTSGTAKDDMYWNMIASTTQAMSAAVAGVDQLTVTPVEKAATSSDFAVRIARNVQHLLIAESYINQVEDIAHGAFYIEHITTQIIEKSWNTFCILAK